MNDIIKELDYNAMLRVLTYKPNFSFQAHKREHQWWFRADMYVENSRDPFDPWEIKRGVRQPTMYDDYDIYFSRDSFPHLREKWYGPQRPLIPVQGNYPIPFFPPGEEMDFIQWVRRTLQSMELHESDEWLKYKGEILFDPHKEN